ncbi:MAG TPA: hypothetical protein PK187_06100 [Candidatus Syntrophosphaera thermopropionivorans]|jgi:IS5 family transposase|nr:hypothetical protein [Candidatus Syntrophosphaera thermopropionivorans]
MKLKKRGKGPVQNLLIKVLLKDIISDEYPLVKLADLVEWEVFEEKIGPTFCEDNGGPGLPIQLMVGLHYLKYTYSLSDETVMEGWVENPY